MKSFLKALLEFVSDKYQGAVVEKLLGDELENLVDLPAHTTMHTTKEGTMTVEKDGKIITLYRDGEDIFERLAQEGNFMLVRDADNLIGLRKLIRDKWYTILYFYPPRNTWGHGVRLLGKIFTAASVAASPFWNSSTELIKVEIDGKEAHITQNIAKPFHSRRPVWVVCGEGSPTPAAPLDEPSYAVAWRPLTTNGQKTLFVRANLVGPVSKPEWHVYIKDNIFESPKRVVLEADTKELASAKPSRFGYLYSEIVARAIERYDPHLYAHIKGLYYVSVRYKTFNEEEVG